jgi:hypothetical protein
VTCLWCQRTDAPELFDVVIDKPRAATHNGQKILKGGKTLKVCTTCRNKLDPKDD